MPPPADLVTRLRAAGCVFAEEEAALLVEAAADPAALEALVVRREAGEPLEQLVGWVEFCGLRLAVAPGVFVPRQRTALLVDEAAALLRPGAVVVDLGCGVGAIAAALVARVPGLEVYAADVGTGTPSTDRSSRSAKKQTMPRTAPRPRGRLVAPGDPGQRRVVGRPTSTSRRPCTRTRSPARRRAPAAPRRPRAGR